MKNRVSFAKSMGLFFWQGACVFREEEIQWDKWNRNKNEEGEFAGWNSGGRTWKLRLRKILKKRCRRRVFGRSARKSGRFDGEKATCRAEEITEEFTGTILTRIMQIAFGDTPKMNS